MGHKEKTLAELIEQADERISTLRGLQRDLSQTKREIEQAITAWKQLASTHLHDELEKIVNHRLNEMYAHVEESEAHAIKACAVRITEAFDILFDQAFRTRDPQEIAAGVKVIRAVTEELNRYGWNAPRGTIDTLTRTMIIGLYGVEQKRQDGTVRTVGETLGAGIKHLSETPPHASLQDERTDVV